MSYRTMIVCDRCGKIERFRPANEPHPDGWMLVKIGSRQFDCCSAECAVVVVKAPPSCLLEEEPL